jgi:integrase
MGRRRTKDLGLPPRVYRRGASFYYVDLSGRWHALGRDETVMRHRWAEMHCVEEVMTIDKMIHTYMAECMGERSENTKRCYRSYANTIYTEWGAHHPDGLTPPILARWRDAEPSKVRANGVLSLLRVAYAKGIEWGHCTTNPAKAVAFNATGERQRYLSDAEVQRIREHLPEWGKTWLDLSYLMGTRVGEALRLKWSEVGDSITKASQKTKVLQTFRVDGELKAVVDGARKRRILGLYVVADEKGRRIGIQKLQAAWREACAAAKVADAQARDIRAKSGTDAANAGLDYQALLGHRDPRTSEIYLRNKRAVLAPQMTRKY